MNWQDAEVAVDQLLHSGELTVDRGSLKMAGTTTNEWDEVVQIIEGRGFIPEAIVIAMEGREFEFRQVEPGYLGIYYQQSDGNMAWNEKLIIEAWSKEHADQQWENMLEDGTSVIWPSWINQDDMNFYDGTEGDGDTGAYVYVRDLQAEEEAAAAGRDQGLEGEELWEYVDEEVGATIIFVTPLEVEAFMTLEDAEKWESERHWVGHADWIHLDEDGDEVTDGDTDENPRRVANPDLKRRLMS